MSELELTWPPARGSVHVHQGAGAEHPMAGRAGFLAGMAWMLLRAETINKLNKRLKRFAAAYVDRTDQMELVASWHSLLVHRPELQIWQPKEYASLRTCWCLIKGEPRGHIDEARYNHGTLANTVTRYVVGNRSYARMIERLANVMAFDEVPRQDLVHAVMRTWDDDQPSLTRNTRDAFAALCTVGKIDQAYELVARAP